MAADRVVAEYSTLRYAGHSKHDAARQMRLGDDAQAVERLFLLKSRVGGGEAMRAAGNDAKHLASLAQVGPFPVLVRGA